MCNVMQLVPFNIVFNVHCFCLPEHYNIKLSGMYTGRWMDVQIWIAMQIDGWMHG